MRRDQEAACDARVVAGREQSERAAYAQVIAGFAAGPNLALAAPMACPVLGEKSIIHRLRSLTMTEIPSGRKKLGIAAIVTTALVALPVTASISYAQDEAPEAPAAPLPPAPPEAPEPPEAPTIETIDPDDAHRIVRVRVEHEGEEGDGHRRMVVRRFGPDGEFDVEEHEFPSRAEMERLFAEMQSELAELEGLDEHLELALVEARRAMEDANHRMVVVRREHEATAEAQARSAEARARGERARVLALEHAEHAHEMALRSMPEIEFSCDGSNNVVMNRELEDGRRVMMICQTAGQNMALNALRQAQRAIRNSPGLAEDERARIVEELQDEIERMEERAEREEVSFAPLPKVKLPAVRLQPVALPAQVIRTSAVRFDMPEAAGKSAKEDCGEETVHTISA
jgi:heme-degrading monooxygenase HmoA